MNKFEGDKFSNGLEETVMIFLTTAMCVLSHSAVKKKGFAWVGMSFIQTVRIKQNQKRHSKFKKIGISNSHLISCRQMMTAKQHNECGLLSPKGIQ
jgi:hypothetical protein